MNGWMGNYEHSKSSFIPKDGETELVWPKSAFKADSFGGYGIPSVTGDKHDVVSKDAPPFFTAVITACHKGEIPVSARCIGSAGSYRFWTTPKGVKTVADWEAVTKELVTEFDKKMAAKAASHKREAEEILQKEVEELSARAERDGMVVVEATIKDEMMEPLGGVPFMKKKPVVLAMDEENRVWCYRINTEKKEVLP